MQDAPTDVLYAVLVHYSNEYRPLWRHVCQSWRSINDIFKITQTTNSDDDNQLTDVSCTVVKLADSEHMQNTASGCLSAVAKIPERDFNSPIVQDAFRKEEMRITTYKDAMSNSIISVTTYIDESTLSSVDCVLPGISVSQIAYRGHYNILCWLYSLKQEFWGCHGELDSIIVAAASGGWVELIPQLAQWHFLNDPRKCWNEVMHAGARSGNEAIVRLCHGTYNAQDVNVSMVFAAQHGHLDLVKVFKMEYGAAFDKEAAHQAVMSGQLHVLQFFVEEQCRLTWPNHVFLMSIAVKYGRLSLLQWLVQKTIQTNISDQHLPIETMLHVATERGHVDVIMWLLNLPQTQQFTTDSEHKHIITLIEVAVRNGHADVARVLMTLPGVDLMRTHSNTILAFFVMAASMGHMNVVRYLYDAMQPLSVQQQQQLNSALNGAANNGHVNMVRLLVEEYHADTIDLAMYYAARCGNMDVVRLCREKYSATFIQDAMVIAAQHGHLDIVLLCRDMYGAPGVDAVLTEAAWNNNLKLVQLICLRETPPPVPSLILPTRLLFPPNQTTTNMTNSNRFVSLDAILKALLNALRRNSKEIARYLYNQLQTTQEQQDASDHVRMRGSAQEGRYFEEWCL